MQRWLITPLKAMIQLHWSKYRRRTCASLDDSPQWPLPKVGEKESGRRKVEMPVVVDKFVRELFGRA